MIYFVEPTTENVLRIVSDYKAGLYSYMHINFSSSISTELLKKFASDIARVSPAPTTQIAKVVDRHCSFVSLDPSMFSLNLASTYLGLHQSSASEADIESSVDRVSLGLLSVVLTCIKQVPVIRAPANGAAGMAAQLLNDRLSELVRSGAASELFSSTTVGSSDPSHAQRPLLVILDRDLDLSPMVAHGWSYASLISDLLGMQLNKVSIPKENKHYDIDPSDAFWKRIAHLPFHDAATAVNEQVNEFSRMRGEVTGDGGSLTSAMSALPQITEMKKVVDMHTTIATTLLNLIKSREIDRFFEIETELNLAALTTLLSEESATPDQLIDRARTAIVVMLRKDGLTAAKIDQIISKLGGSDDAASAAAKYVKYLLGLRNLLPPTIARDSSNPGANPVVLPGMLGGLAEKVKSRGEGLLAAGLKNLKNILPVNENLVVTNTVQQLADQTPNPLTDAFLYFDPKNAGSTVRVRGSFRQVIVCVVGGGALIECENVTAWGSRTGRTVVYGATDFPTPAQFVKDLAKLGGAGANR